MTNEMTHDDIINKEIEEEHEFMRARIKELENKPTYPFNEAFNKQLQEENETLKSKNFTFEELITTQENELEKLKQKNEYLINTHCHFKNELKKYKKAVHKYKIVLLDKIKQLYLSRREFLKEINCVLTRIAYKDEEFKNILDKFNNDIPVINNEDKYKQALDEIEGYINTQLFNFGNDVYSMDKSAINNIQDIIHKTKDGSEQ